MITEHYPYYDSENPPDVATLGACYDELRDDAIRLEKQNKRLTEFARQVMNASGGELPIIAMHLLQSLARESASLHCHRPPLIVRVTDRTTGEFYYASEAAECRPQHEDGFRVAVAHGCSCSVGDTHYQLP